MVKWSVKIKLFIYSFLCTRLETRKITDILIIIVYNMYKIYVFHSFAIPLKEKYFP